MNMLVFDCLGYAMKRVAVPQDELLMISEVEKVNSDGRFAQVVVSNGGERTTIQVKGSFEDVLDVVEGRPRGAFGHALERLSEAVTIMTVMKEKLNGCPFCNRPPEERHTDTCGFASLYQGIVTLLDTYKGWRA